MDDQIEAPRESEFTTPDDVAGGRSPVLDDLAAQLYMFARRNDRPAGDVMQAARHVRSCARACLVPGATSS